MYLHHTLPARIIHEQVNNPPFDRLRALRYLDGLSGPFDMLKAPREIEGLRLRGSTELAEVPAFAGRRPSTGATEATPVGALFTKALRS